MMMDTPLYVLSTAASMLANADCLHKTDTDMRALSTSPRQRTSPKLHGNHGNLHGHERMKKEYTVLTSTSMTARDDLHGSRPKKCAGTQTSFSSFGSSPYQRPRSPRASHTNGCPQSNGCHSPHTVPDSTDNNHRHGSSPPPYDYQHTSLRAHMAFHNGYGTSTAYKNEETDMDTDAMPLNLTISSTSHQNHDSNTSRRGETTLPPYSSVSSRPSVITRSAPLAADIPHSQSHTPSGVSPNGLPDSMLQPPEAASTAATGTVSRRPIHDASTGEVQPSDPGIEEHFRRSLGTKYDRFIGQQNGRNSPTNSTEKPSSTTESQNVSITGNVDDHFAKSLGDTWTKLNTKKDDGESGSVDDHFAKALGDTWFKIKAQKETTSHTNSSSSSSSHLLATRPFTGPSYTPPSTIRL